MSSTHSHGGPVGEDVHRHDAPGAHVHEHDGAGDHAAHDDHGHDHGSHAGHDDHGHDHGHDHGGHGHDHGDHDHDHGSGLWAQIKHAITPHSHDAAEAIQTATEARTDGIRTAWIGLAGMLAVAVAQIAIVAISGSIGLLADTIHSFGHVVTTIPLIIAFKLSARKPTARYNYGFRRAEDLSGIFITFIVLLTALYIAYESIMGLINPRELTNLGWVFAAGLVGFLGNEIVAVYRIRGGKRIGSAALIAEGQHARADGFTSLAVVVGISLAWLGFPQADAIVGLFIAVVILGIMLSSLRSILRRLMDGVDPKMHERATKVVKSVPGVQDATVRARWSGHRIMLEAFVEVDPNLSLAAGKGIADEIRTKVGNTIGGVESTTVEFGKEPVHT